MKVSEMTNEELLANYKLRTQDSAIYHAELLRRMNAGEPGKPRCPKCSRESYPMDYRKLS